MAHRKPILITGAGGGTAGVGRRVVELLRERGVPVRAMVHREDERAQALRDNGAQVVVGDLARPSDVAAALVGCERMFFVMSVSPVYLEAAVTVATVAREAGALKALVSLSQMTVSQMTAVSSVDRSSSACSGRRNRCSDGRGFRSCRSARPSFSRTRCSRR